MSATKSPETVLRDDSERTGTSIAVSDAGATSKESTLDNHENGKKDIITTPPTSFPDGGLRAWLVVCGGACTTFATFGFVNSWGVFQSYYETQVLKDTSSSAIAWIGSIQYALIFMPAVLIGRLFDLGWFKLPYAIGSVGLVLSAFLIAQCTTYWQFILAQGLLVGASCGICFGPMIGVVGHWFLRRRGFALSITAVGSSIGGTVLPIVTRELLPRVGKKKVHSQGRIAVLLCCLTVSLSLRFQWTMRILGVILAFVLGVGNLTMKRRLPAKNVAGGLFNFKALKSPAFTIFCCSTLVAFLGMYTLLTFISSSAVAVGIPQGFSFYLVSISNAGSGLGRITAGLIVDKIGAVNNIVPMTVAAALITYLWPLAHTQNAYIAVAALYGFTSAAYVSTFQLPLYELGELEDVGRRAGMVMTFAAFGAIAGPPISGAILHASGGFSAVGYYAASMMLLACLLIMTTRHLVLGKFWGKF
ncbi:putative monocarboxylate [Lyophyllum shimeji]|uniref:Monocarboxylate n=1 Tax=Lyophyllum shimeji TaxID=47721 RepID=A0A9P3PEJ7_LYOSH|nr:putative monocarboxylate [Lyophyllum shimeji]